MPPPSFGRGKQPYGSVAQSVEQRPFKALVVGSSPTRPTNLAATCTFIENEGMNSAADPTGTIEVALQHAGQLLGSNPVLALEQAREILKAAPNHPVATLMLGRAQRLTGNLDEAVRTLKVPDGRPAPLGRGTF